MQMAPDEGGGGGGVGVGVGVGGQLQLLGALANRRRAVGAESRDKTSAPGASQSTNNSTHFLQQLTQLHAHPNKQTKLNTFHLNRHHDDQSNWPNERELERHASNWHQLHYSNDTTTTTTGAKLAHYAHLNHHLDDAPQTLADVQLRQNQLLNLFTNQFKLEAVMAKIFSTNARAPPNLAHRNHEHDHRDATAQNKPAQPLELLKHAAGANFDHLAQLSCDSGEMIIRLNFSQPFKGIVYPDHSRLSPCRFFGDGHHNYELRLPLRGCGTKQVAPRVFVNDVIVRFHKTLELEEDEVKTLICRYPPPLEGQPANGSGADERERERERTAAGNGLVHRLAAIDLNRPQLEQFELLEPAGARPTDRLGQQETFGELLAPPSSAGRHQQQASQTLLELQQHQRAKQQTSGAATELLAPPPFIVTGAGKTLPKGQLRAPNNSAHHLGRPFENLETLADGSSAANEAALQPSAGFLDRLSSLQLLLLISALMFLVLLALFLLALYYCVWRPRRRRRVGSRDPLAGPASGGRRRKLRYFNAPHLAALATSGRPSYTPAQPYLTPAGATATTSGSLYQPQQAAARQALYYQRYLSQQQQQMAPSSPDDSDLSNQVLLPPPPPPPPPTSIRGRLTAARPQHAHAHAGRTLMLHQRAPSRREQDDEVASQQHHHRASTIARHPQPRPLVAGRREQMGASGGADPVGGSQTLGRRAEANCIISSGGHLGENLFYAQPSRGAFSASSSSWGAKTGALGQPAGEPLLKLASSGGNGDHDGREPASYHRSHKRHLYSANGTTSAGQEQGPSLRPARSMQQLGANKREPGELVAWQKHQQQLARFRPDFFATTHFEVESGGRQAAAKQQSSQKGAHEYQEQAALIDYKRPRQRHQATGPPPRLVSAESSSASSASASDSELELGHNSFAARRDGSTSEQQPRLILRSIEDSFVTNFTEINQQEFMKYDTRRPLNWPEWCQSQPSIKRVGSGQLRRKEAGHEAGRPSGSESEAEQLEEPEEPEELEELEELVSSEPQMAPNGGVRSLTELDVNFAKSLPRPQRPTKEGVAVRGPARVSSELQAAAGAKGGPKRADGESIKGAGKREAATPSPDLIISPEYNFGRFRLFEGSPTGGGGGRSAEPTSSGPREGDTRKTGARSPASESHESVSYV